MDPGAFAKKLGGSLAETKIRLMTRIVLIVERNVKKNTRVDTGRLRNSITSRVERAGERGRVGTTIYYMAFQKNKPLEEGLADSQNAIQAELEEAGAELLARVTS